MKRSVDRMGQPEDRTKCSVDRTGHPGGRMKCSVDRMGHPGDRTKRSVDRMKWPVDGIRKPEDGTNRTEDRMSRPEDRMSHPVDGTPAGRRDKPDGMVRTKNIPPEGQGRPGEIRPPWRISPLGVSAEPKLHLSASGGEP